MCKYNLLSVFLAIITVNYYLHYTKASRTFNKNGVEIILALENENVIIECKPHTPMRYCGLIHPSGKRYYFSGPTTNVGKCSIKLKATSNYTGTWRCDIGSGIVGVETTKWIQLRVVESQIAAVESNVTAMHGKSYTLYCTTIKGVTPLSYCRFQQPNCLTFSIDSSVTESKPLLERYYFPSNKSLDRGDCAVTISKVTYDDVGKWTCSAGWADGHDYTDVIYFNVEGLYSLTSTTIVSIIFGVIAFVILIVLGVLAWRYQWCLGSIRRRVATVENRELQQIPTAASPRRAASTPQPERSVPSVVIEPSS